MVLLDDLDVGERWMVHYLKIWSDKYSFNGEVKGGTVPLSYSLFIVTSNYSIEELFQPEEKKEL